MSKSFFCPTAEGLCHIAIDGDPAKRPLVILGGLGSQWFDWHDMIPYLETHYYIIRIDRPGYGKSTHAQELFIPSLASEVARIIDIKDYLRITDRICLIAHSMGAFYAEACALLHPDEIAAMVLVDPSSPDNLRPAYFPQHMTEQITEMILRGSTALRLPELMGHILWRWCAKINPPQPLSLQRRKLIDYYSRRSIYWQALIRENCSYRYLASNTRELWDEHGANFTTPTMIISAQKNDAQPSFREKNKVYAHRQHANRLGAQHSTITSSSHCIHYDQPEILSAIIDQFIRHAAIDTNNADGHTAHKTA